MTRGAGVRRMLGFVLCGVLAIAGCAGPSTATYRLARYRPDSRDRDPAAWVGPAATEVTVPATAAGTVTNGVLPAMEADRGVLESGDAVNVSLRGPTTEDLREVIDARGMITLPLIDEIRVAGLTTSQAEAAIAREYMTRKYYRNITVIVVAREGDYYVRGEVARQGKYTVQGDVTLLQAIAEAGGFTPYARRSRIQVIREGASMTYDSDRIEEGRDPDPVIKAGDIIIVGRRYM